MENYENVYTQIVIKELVTRIREKLSNFVDPFIYGDFCNSSCHEKEFQLVRDSCVLINELLSYVSIKEKILNMAIETTNDSDNKLDVQAKYDTFKMLRNLFIHFPIFDRWDEVYINKELLEWNKPKNCYILKYFNEYGGKNLTCNIYTKYSYDENWRIGCTIKLKIPNSLPKKDKMYLNDFMSFSDVKRIFCIVDYYLDYLGFDLIQYQYLSI